MATKQEQATISRNQLVNELMNIGHGNLSIFVPVGRKAVRDEPELFGHMIAWNEKKGEVRDSKKAFPVLALRGEKDLELYENAVAHLLLLDPKNLCSAVEFSKGLTKGEIRYKEKIQVKKGQYRFEERIVKVNPENLGDGAKKLLVYGVEQYLRVREANRGWLLRSMLQHRHSMKELYARFHIKPNRLAKTVLFDRGKPKGTVFEALANMKNMSPIEAAGTILNYKIPFVVAVGSLGGIKDKPDVVMALIEQMSGAELINNTEMLRKAGTFDNPVLKSAYDSALERARSDKKLGTLKAGKAIEKIGDKKVQEKVKQIQEEKLQQLGGIEGDWAILADMSGSMHEAIEKAKFAASVVAKQTKGKVYLIFFNTSPTKYDVSGKSLEEIKRMTSRITARGGTSIGCGLELLGDSNVVVNGIAIFSDGGDNTHPYFHTAYDRYRKKTGIEPTVYLYWLSGERNVLTNNCKAINIPFVEYNISKTDYYSLPNLITSMRSSRFTLIDEIMEMPLLTINEALKRGKE